MQSAYRGIWYVNRWTQDPKTTANRRLPGTKSIQRPQEERIAIPVPAIIGNDQWELAQLRLADARRRWQDRQNGARSYLLSGWCTCGLCGGAVHGYSYQRPVDKHRRSYYLCNHRIHRTSGKCPLPFFRAEELEGEVWSRVSSWLQDPRRLERELKQMNENPPPSQGELESLKQSIAATEQEADRLTSLYVKGLVDPAKAESQLAEIRKRTAFLQGRMGEILRRNEFGQVQDKEWVAFREFAARYKKRLSGLTFKEKQGIIRLLVSRVELFPDSRVTIHARVPKSLAGF